MPSRIFATIILNTMLCLATSAYLHAQQTTITPPSNLPANTPAGYNLIVPVFGQQESEWCWAASNKMVFEYDSPLPPVLQCEEANGATGRSDCCTNPGSASCNQGDSDAGGKYPFAYFGAPSGMPLTWDQLRYQIWGINKPFTFGWNWVGGGSHVQVVTGYYTDPQGNESVYVNNPEPVGIGDAEVMSYQDWVENTSPTFKYGAHTHEGDWFDFTLQGTRLIYNLATNTTTPTNALTDAQAPNLTGTVLSDQVVPFQITGGLFSISGSVQERVVREAGSQKLDFYYHITNAAGSNGVVNALTIRDFGRFTAAAAFRPDSLGTVPALSTGRDISGSTVQIFPQVIAPGSSSFFILLMTNATTYDSQGTLTIIGVNPQMPWFRGHVQLATDQPTG